MDPPKPFQIHKENPIDGLKKRFLPISNRYYLTVYCCRFSLTLPSIVATQEFVVPKSMPITSLPAAAFPLRALAVFPPVMPYSKEDAKAAAGVF
jgi:hypothetical protein